MLHKALEEIADTPLLRRTMGILNAGVSIDEDYSNAYSAWLSMDRTAVPDRRQVARLQARMGLESFEPARTIEAVNGELTLKPVLPPHSVSLWLLEKL